VVTEQLVFPDKEVVQLHLTCVLQTVHRQFIVNSLWKCEVLRITVFGMWQHIILYKLTCALHRRAASTVRIISGQKFEAAHFSEKLVVNGSIMELLYDFADVLQLWCVVTWQRCT